MTVDYQQSHVVVSKLSAGSSFIVSVTTTQGRAQSDALTSIITTGIELTVNTNTPVLAQYVKTTVITIWLLS